MYYSTVPYFYIHLKKNVKSLFILSCMWYYLKMAKILKTA